MEQTLRICPKGHKYYKSTDCPTCPICEYSEKELLKLHGIGPASLPILRKCLEEEGLSFKSK